MSEENVEIVRRGYEHYNRTDEADYDLLDPEIDYDVSRRAFDPLVYRPRGVREFTALIREQWATMRLEPQEVIDPGDRVVVSVRLVGVGKESGGETTANAAHVWAFRDGKILRPTTFQTMSDALEAAGLPE